MIGQSKKKADFSISENDFYFEGEREWQVSTWEREY
jgi:hypothetical protein